jgi:hypothetical protein
MATPIQLLAVLFAGNASDDELVIPASLLACCTNAGEAATGSAAKLPSAVPANNLRNLANCR